MIPLSLSLQFWVYCDEVPWKNGLLIFVRNITARTSQWVDDNIISLILIEKGEVYLYMVVSLTLFRPIALDAPQYRECMGSGHKKPA